LLGLASFAASSSTRAQDSKPTTFLDKQAARTDFALSGYGEFSTSGTGKNWLGETVTVEPSKTIGYTVALRYIKAPLKGFEINYSKIRYSNNFNQSASPYYNPPAEVADPAATYDLQSNTNQFTVGYVAHTRKPHFGLKPFAVVGGGEIHFIPTVNGGGGLGFRKEYRPLAYYGIGAEQYLGGDHFGFRVQFRQTFYTTPDFFAPFLVINQHTITSEPVVGLFLRF
jgi:hypothetical protein